MKRVFLIGMMAAALAFVGAPKAEAAQITGAFSIASSFVPGQGPVIPVNGATGVQTSVNVATGLDFTTTGALTPGVAGNFTVNAASGSFLAAGLGGATGQIKDFSFAGAGTPGTYPLPPIAAWEVITVPTSLSVVLNTVNIFAQGSNGLVLTGTVTFTLAGFDPTPGAFVFTVAQGDTTFSFSAAEVVVPEPGSMVLLGTGLLGLAAAARRMRKA